MNEFHPNLEKATSSVLSVILINLWIYKTLNLKNPAGVFGVEQVNII